MHLTSSILLDRLLSSPSLCFSLAANTSSESVHVMHISVNISMVYTGSINISGGAMISSYLYCYMQ